MNEVVSERRRYFRIDDVIAMSYKIMASGGANAAVKSIQSDLSEIDHEIRSLLLQVQEENPAIARLLGLMNEKIDLLEAADRTFTSITAVSEISETEANLSACGIAFHASEAIAKGSLVQLRLQLLPDQELVTTKGVIVGCDSAEDDQKFYWRIDFHDMNEQAQEALIQHVVQAQMHQLRAKRLPTIR